MKINFYKYRVLFYLQFFAFVILNAQDQHSLFETIPADLFSGVKPLKFGNILCTSRGTVLVAYSMGLSEIDKMQIEVTLTTSTLTDEKGNKMYLGKNSNIFKDQYESRVGIKLICEGPDKIIYVVSDNNNIGIIYYQLGKAIGFPPFNFLGEDGKQKTITTIWIDGEGTLFIGTNTDTIYTVANATKIFKLNTQDQKILPFMPGLDKDSNFVVTQGARTINKFSLGPGIIPYSFAQDSEDARIMLIGTNNGLYGYDKQTGQSINYFKDEKNGAVTITNLETNKLGSVIWFSTLEKGMARYNIFTKSIRFFEYPKKITGDTVKFPVNTFSRKSMNEFFVAIDDSLPAVFNTETGKYSFINDTIFSKMPNRTKDIKADALGNLYISKGGSFYWSKTWMQKNAQAFKTDSSLYGPFITDIMLGGIRYNSKEGFFQRDELLKEINLKYDENKIEIYYSCRGILPDSLIFAWKMDNYSNDWIVSPYSVFGEGTNMISFDNLKPGKYIFRVKAKNASHDWLGKRIELVINIANPYWQTWWFWASVITGLSLLIFFIVKLRVNTVRKQERIKAEHEKELLQMEAKALRSQMNPHFIYNCMNSIKSLIQLKDEDKSIRYLTTFSKLIRTLFQNSDKRLISLYDEIETCRLYVQLEAMRLNYKLTYEFNIDPNLDLKSVMVPALIIQPFIENAIWHGIVPKGEGNITITVKGNSDVVICEVDDDGIGREMSKLNKPVTPVIHESRGVHLSQARLNLGNLLNEMNATIETKDKYNDGVAAGTLVTLTFNLN